MIKYNHYKVHAITFLLSVFPTLIYMYFYVNGYFGDRLVNWWLLKDIVDSIFHPINILGWVVVVFVLLRLLGKKFYIVQHSKAEIVKTHLAYFGLFTAIMVVLYLYNKALSAYVGIFYCFLVSYLVIFYFVASYFSRKQVIN